MARWDDERLQSLVPPKDIMCTSCKFKAQPVVVCGSSVDRSGYAMCEKFSNKPVDILYGRIPCPHFEEEL